ncbi:hypothetical protein IFM89_013710 [Coptis chinensis]|uniref:Glucan endo-1,3-beta-D-glucosidase n=1 Tax=Coptis chinensis TaxID=261450 RepID=A0A835LAX0_9MAGN|nr:hypothetical protein IFM89_013710 [Coptis chinensis]
MRNLHTALVGMSLDRQIKVSTPHSFGILSSSSTPSTGKFRKGYDTIVLKPLLSFLRATSSPFIINPYPFFGCSADTHDYALFRPNTALKLLGFSDLAIVIVETDDALGLNISPKVVLVMSIALNQ